MFSKVTVFITTAQ